ncbi:Src-like-adaptor 2 [Cricetulus griseus]
MTRLARSRIHLAPSNIGSEKIYFSQPVTTDESDGAQEARCYSLSIRLSRPSSWDRIRHYRIQRLDNGWLYISPRLTFPSLQALVDHYSELADDICCVLKEPCVLQKLGPLPGKDIPLPVTVQAASLNWKELDSTLFLEAPASGQASLLSEGLRESLSSYISLTEDNSLDDA